MKPILHKSNQVAVTQCQRFWNNRDNKERQKNGVFSLCMLNGNPISGDESGCLRFYSLVNDQLDSKTRKIPGHSHVVCCLAVINESVVASGSQGELNSIRVWNLADGTCMATLKGHKNTVSALVVLQKGTILASSSHDGTIKIWDWRQNQKGQIRQIKAHGYPILCMVKSYDQKFLLSGGDDYRIKMWDAQNFVCLRTLEAHIGYVSSLCWLDESTFASGSSSGELFIWSMNDIRNGNIETPMFDNMSQSENIMALTYLPKRRILVSVSQNKQIKFWEVSTGKLAYSIESAHEDTINCITASEDESQIITGCWDGLIKVWKIQQV